jgi:DnaK suppressor protein
MAKKSATKARPKQSSAKKTKTRAAAKPAGKTTTTKSSGKETSMAGKGKGGKKATESESKKPAVLRSATKLSGKGVLIRTAKRAAAPAPVVPEERVKLRHVNATEKSKGENPITLHHRKPTKAESDEFRDLLVVRRKQLQGDVDGLEAEAFSDETQHVSSNHLADSSFEQYEQEFNLSMIENETEELKEIGRALEKIDRGTFGVCEACGIDISIERLRVMPYTRICIHCRNKFEEEGGGDVYGVHPERRV